MCRRTSSRPRPRRRSSPTSRLPALPAPCWAGLSRRRRSCRSPGRWRRCLLPHSRISGAVARNVMADVPALDGSVDARMVVRRRAVAPWSSTNPGATTSIGSMAPSSAPAATNTTAATRPTAAVRPAGGGRSRAAGPASAATPRSCTASARVSNPAYCGGAAVGSGGDGGASGGGCSSVAGGFCPIECMTCQSR